MQRIAASGAHSSQHPVELHCAPPCESFSGWSRDEIGSTPCQDRGAGRYDAGQKSDHHEMSTRQPPPFLLLAGGTRLSSILHPGACSATHSATPRNHHLCP